MRSKSLIVAAYCFIALLLFPVVSSAADYTVFKGHPRLYFNKSKLASLRALKNDPLYSTILNNVRIRSKALVGARVPNNLIRFDMNSLRRPADGLTNLAFYCTVSEDKISLSTAFDLIRTFCSDSNWAGNNDLGAAHTLFALSVAYDWLYDDLSSALRLMAKDSIAEHAEILYKCLNTRDIWWAQPRGFMQNHNYVNSAALAIAGIALYGQDPRAEKWLKTAEKNFDTVSSLLSPDGASHEGVGYWSYGTLWLLNYYMALEPAQGLEKVKLNPFFKNTAKFRLYASLPGFHYNIDYADSPLVDYKGPGAILRCLASIFNDGHAQWLAQRVEEEKRGRSILWQDYLWNNPDITPISPDTLPTFEWFDNLGILLSRSSWKDDASLAFFKAGPPQGLLAHSKGFYSGSHIHPDEGHFGFWSGRNPLAMDDGYVLKKLSTSHNILTFDKLGQLGEGGTWFQLADYKKGNVNVSKPNVNFGKNFQAVEVELSGYYPVSIRPKSWKRCIIVLNGTDMIIRDKVIPSGKTEVYYPLHLTRKARQMGGGICLDYGQGFALNFDGADSELSLRRYSILTRPMGKSIPRGGMLYSSTRTTSNLFSMLTILGKPTGNCAENKMIESFNRAKDSAVIVCKSGKYRINFSTLSVEKI
ncbi:DUF4962 domain-containing protein [Desulfovibrio gilichinskyi]|uniref:Heparinase II/III-like protein n=1 Tax=Desulfovibrio gilichinskyi TaxID=1519643 RepID=A0A1X7C725_9BACT|nr:DUF4962 domain-containing protein [Desulfovibrio gilichinskyi]SME90731.1 Heparinase II/III-like protein [Desulfovibrio gilichinskyi]